MKWNTSLKKKNGILLLSIYNHKSGAVSLNSFMKTIMDRLEGCHRPYTEHILNTKGRPKTHL